LLRTSCANVSHPKDERTASGERCRSWCGGTARRAQIGARSERLVDVMLEPLRLEDWEIRTNVRWPENGDVDVVAIAPGGPTFVIETKADGEGVREGSGPV